MGESGRTASVHPQRVEAILEARGDRRLPGGACGLELPEHLQRLRAGALRLRAAEVDQHCVKAEEAEERRRVGCADPRVLTLQVPALHTCSALTDREHLRLTAQPAWKQPDHLPACWMAWVCKIASIA